MYIYLRNLWLHVCVRAPVRVHMMAFRYIHSFLAFWSSLSFAGALFSLSRSRHYIIFQWFLRCEVFIKTPFLKSNVSLPEHVLVVSSCCYCLVVNMLASFSYFVGDLFLFRNAEIVMYYWYA